MTDKAHAQFPKDYRSARKAFIAACTKAHADSIARVHPKAAGPRGNPLFLDSVALGPRDAARALLVVAGSDGREIRQSSAVLTGLLDGRIAPQPDARLVLVHALNPFGAAWDRHENENGKMLDRPEGLASWSYDMLRAVLTEDLSRVTKMRALELSYAAQTSLTDGGDSILAQVLTAARPVADIHVARLALAPRDALAAGQAVVARALADL
ncbi:MAG TPA: DUF2817 domain-containing protein [Rhizomicrobium sp.]|jgi:hypothetical protein|nr:DUF2817 domain-containing protein [Rhizomicrobium sp.]